LAFAEALFLLQVRILFPRLNVKTFWYRLLKKTN